VCGAAFPGDALGLARLNQHLDACLVGCG
jgi:hypothetical protein